MEEIKEEINEVKEQTTIVEVDEPINGREDLTLNKFMDDMNMLGTQVRNPSLNKPTFHYGDAAVTNYLLWLMLGELMILNDKLSEDEE